MSFSIPQGTTAFLPAAGEVDSVLSSNSNLLAAVAETDMLSIRLQSYNGLGNTTVSWNDQNGPQSFVVTVEQACSPGNVRVSAVQGALK